MQKALPHLGYPYLSVEQITELETICTYLFSKKKLTANELRHKLISQNIDFGLNLLNNNLHIRCFSTTYVWINADKILLQPIDYTLFGSEVKDVATDEATIAGFVDSAL